ncbi:MAG: MlaE family lipid ABC transporter permease subunit [Desulfobacteraceae bacterium]|nr:MAG: MlaE family lipid ABC transporter permease subunit [Desulfobacteraceae bacterium]
MKKPDQIKSGYYNLSEDGNDSYTVHFHGKLDADSSSEIIARLICEVNSLSFTSLTADIDEVSYFEDFGLLLLIELRKAVKEKNGEFRITDKNGRAKDIISLTEEQLLKPQTVKRNRPSLIIENFGESVFTSASNFTIFISFLGSAILSFYQVCRNPKLLRVNDTILCMEKAGVNALPVVALISFLLGLVIAFMSSLQLEQFGANLYVASLVSIAMVSELGPIMTAIVVAGRSGSAFAAEIGTMKISEETDALFVMGFDPILFLAVPRILASIIVVPLLTLFSDIFAIAGGLVVGVLILDLTTSSYITQTIKVLTLFEIVWGMSKSAVFALIISWVGCLRGFQTRGGADAVGNAATSAVVSGIFLIILFDSMFAVGRSFMK